MTGEIEREKLYHIGVMIGNVYTNHPKELLHGICMAAKKYPVVLEFFLGTQSSGFYQELTGEMSDASFEYQFNAIYDFALYGDLDALIISYGTLCIFLEEQEQQEFFKKYEGIPQVILEERRQGTHVSSFISDNYQGICQLMEHLIRAHGCKKILHISGPRTNLDAEERKRAYLDTMRRFALPVSEDMILTGDYSQYITDEVAAFLERHPDADAVCAANDAMAVSVYKACARKGLRIGRDIAVTGYDNSDMASSLEPSLTTVEQNGYDMGYMALEEAVRLCQGESGRSSCLPAKPIFRESCGCGTAKSRDYLQNLKEETLLQAIPEIAAGMTDEILLSTLNEALRRDVQEKFERLVAYTIEGIYFSKEAFHAFVCSEQILELLGELQRCGWTKELSLPNAISSVNQFLTVLSGLTTQAHRKQNLLGLMRLLNESVMNRYRYGQSETEIDYNRKIWQGPLQVWSMIACARDERTAYLEAVRSLSRQNMKSAYILLFETPVVYERGERWECPERLFLAAYHDGKEACAYEPWERPIVTRKHGFSGLLQGRGHTYMAFFLFFQQTQYGVLLCEIGSNEISTAYVSSMQLATAIHCLELSKKEWEMNERLQEMMREVEAKNELLHSMSNTDALTGLLNRRGLAEKLRQQMLSGEDDKAHIVFADLDHLKQINDNFGHAEGDFAICQIGEILKTQAGERALVARIGGDEFVVVLFAGEERDDYVARVREECRRRNEKGKKPFWVECSLGSLEFSCTPKTEIERLLSRADAIMYRAKKERRDSVLKKILEEAGGMK